MVKAVINKMIAAFSMSKPILYTIFKKISSLYKENPSFCIKCGWTKIEKDFKIVYNKSYLRLI